MIATMMDMMLTKMVTRRLNLLAQTATTRTMTNIAGDSVGDAEDSLIDGVDKDRHGTQSGGTDCDDSDPRISVPLMGFVNCDGIDGVDEDGQQTQSGGTDCNEILQRMV